jgi:hypothetical protein
VLCARFVALGIFLGTPGPNQKVVVFAKDKDTAWFIKVPINEKTRALAQREAATLKTLAADKDLARLVPQCHWVKGALAVEDVRIDGARFAALDRAEIMRVHQLLFKRSRTIVPFAKLVEDWAAQDEASVSPLDAGTAAQITAARNAAFGFVEAIPELQPVECYEAHGDFTQWNVLAALDGSARIIDWELFGRRPKFFDPFHYLVSRAILLERAAPDTILQQARQLTVGIIGNEAFSLYFGSYITAQVFYYSHLYEMQDILHAQGYWQLETWTAILEALVTTIMPVPEAGQAPT